MAVKFFDTQVDITFGVGETGWQSIDAVNDCGCDSTVTGVIVEIINTHTTSAQTSGYRVGGDTGFTGYLGMVTSSHQYIIIGVDANKEFEIYVGSYADIKIRVVGYFNAESVFFTSRQAMSAADGAWTGMAWDESSIASLTGSDTAIAAIVEVYNTQGVAGRIGGRSADSSSTDTLAYCTSNPRVVMVVPVNGSEALDIYNDYITGLTVSLIGYMKSGAVFHSAPVDQSTATTGSFVDLPTALNSNALGGIFWLKNGTSAAYSFAIKKKGYSGTVDYLRVSRYSTPAIIPCDSNKQVQHEISNTYLDLLEIGYLITDRQTLALTGIAAAGGVGSPTLAFPVSLTGIAAGGVVGAVTLVPGSVTISATGIAPSGSVGTPALQPGTATLSLAGIAPTGGVGTAAVLVVQTVSMTGIAASNQFGTITFVPGSVTLPLTGIAPSGAVGTAAVTPGTVTLSVTGIAAAGGIGTPVIMVTQTINPSGIAATSGMGAITIVPGSVTVAMSGIAPTGGVGAANVLPGAYTITPSGIAASGGVGSISLSIGPATLLPAGIAPSGGVGLLTISPGPVTVSATGIAATGGVGTISLSIYSPEQMANPTGIAPTGGVGTISFSVGPTTLVLSGIAPAGGVGTAGVYTVYYLPLTGIAAGGGVGTVAILPGAVTLELAGIASAAALGVPLLTAAGWVRFLVAELSDPLGVSLLPEVLTVVEKQ